MANIRYDSNLIVMTGRDSFVLATCYASSNGRVRPRLWKKRRPNEASAALGRPKRALQHFLEVGNGKETPENVVISRFYTAWTNSGRSERTRV
jgi:hypothetical protein